MRAEVILCAALGLAAAVPAGAGEPAYRYSAPIEVRQPGAFVQLPLAPSAYAHTEQPGLADLRVVDAAGERVPFAVLAPRAAEAMTGERLRPAALYALPARPDASGAWQSPVEVRVDGERISVKRRAGVSNGAAAAQAGWLIDLGERDTATAAPRAVRLQWTKPSEFSAAYDFDSSDDLRLWRRGGSGQVMQLASTAGPLTQPDVTLPAGTGRFVRLVWAVDGGAVPALGGAQSVTAERTDRTLDPPTDLLLAATPEPSGARSRDADAKRALHFDLGAVLPIVQIDLQLEGGTRVVPVRIQGRNRADAAWADLGATVYYRLEREGAARSSPPLVTRAAARYVRLVPDERAAALDAARTRLAIKVQLASLVFATQGRPPYMLLGGAPDLPSSALPVSALVPALEQERERFGKAELGPWVESAEAAARARARARQAAMRPYLLWAVLLLGVAGLGWMAWRLARAPRAERDAG